MTSLTIPQGQMAPAGTPPTAPQESSINYLHRSVELIDPHTAQWTHFTGYAYAAISKIILVAFAALAATALILTGVFSSVSALPFTSLAILVLAAPTLDASESMQKIAAETLKAAERSKNIKAIHDRLPSTKEGLQDELTKIGLPFEQIDDPSIREDVTPLRPVLAHYFYWKKTAESSQKESEQKIQDAEQHQTNYPGELEEIDDHRLKSVCKEEEALLAKTQASFYYGLLLHPRFSSDFKEVISFTHTVEESQHRDTNVFVLGRRAFLARFNDSKAVEFLTIQGKTNVSVTFQEARDLSIPDLSRRIFA